MLVYWGPASAGDTNFCIPHMRSPARNAAMHWVGASSNDKGLRSRTITKSIFLTVQEGAGCKRNCRYPAGLSCRFPDKVRERGNRREQIYRNLGPSCIRIQVLRRCAFSVPVLVLVSGSLDPRILVWSCDAGPSSGACRRSSTGSECKADDNSAVSVKMGSLFR